MLFQRFVFPTTREARLIQRYLRAVQFPENVLPTLIPGFILAFSEAAA
jgi:hypothetical protein